ncbi:hypothetical protein BDV41DRAFT_377599 [Aspergillus transmontanensis]|uniref:Uncharacterized protein n=1 Tax=Aspergillus transmontanensis TaxID=1034304 RepID=A0A5N6WCC9_9EURO|nr:hypothetical protein BDV41DRAFT_377599 [Aspergillus transmontanensis]
MLCSLLIVVQSRKSSNRSFLYILTVGFFGQHACSFNFWGLVSPVILRISYGKYREDLISIIVIFLLFQMVFFIIFSLRYIKIDTRICT